MPTEARKVMKVLKMSPATRLPNLPHLKGTLPLSSCPLCCQTLPVSSLLVGRHCLSQLTSTLSFSTCIMGRKNRLYLMVKFYGDQTCYCTLKITVAYSIKWRGKEDNICYIVYEFWKHSIEAALSIPPVPKRMPFKAYVDLPKVTSLYEVEPDLEFRIVWLLRLVSCTNYFSKCGLGLTDHTQMTSGETQMNIFKNSYIVFVVFNFRGGLLILPTS